MRCKIRELRRWLTTDKPRSSCPEIRYRPKLPPPPLQQRHIDELAQFFACTYVQGATERMNRGGRGRTCARKNNFTRILTFLSHMRTCRMYVHKYNKCMQNYVYFRTRGKGFYAHEMISPSPLLALSVLVLPLPECSRAGFPELT